jgi:hypothetical protein
MLSLHRATLFVSYSHNDNKFASRLVDDLRQLGCRVWIDEKDMEVGDSIPKSVEKGIRKSRFFLVIMSSESVKSKWVPLELMEAKRRGKTILPLSLDDAAAAFLKTLLPGTIYIDFASIGYEDGRNLIIKRLYRRSGLSIRKLLPAVLILLLFLLAAGSSVAYILLWKEKAHVEDAQRHVQLLDDGMTRGEFSRVGDVERRLVTFYTPDSHVIGRDVFDAKTDRIMTRSYYDADGNRFAIDRFEWQDGSAIKKLRIHFDANRDEFMREEFSLTGKLERKRYDKYRNGNFIEREADFVSPFPSLFFPVFYR